VHPRPAVLGKGWPEFIVSPAVCTEVHQLARDLRAAARSALTAVWLWANVVRTRLGRLASYPSMCRRQPCERIMPNG
jgi:hypothetical protein